MAVAIETGDNYRFLPRLRDRRGPGRHASMLRALMIEIKTRGHRAYVRHGNLTRKRSDPGMAR
jgi:hypothetical protein